MNFKYISLIIGVFYLLINGFSLSSQEISDQESKRLVNFFKKRYGTQMPNNAVLNVNGLVESPIEGFKEGTLVIQASGGTGEVKFFISRDGKHIIIGDPVNTDNFENTQEAGIKKGSILFGNQNIPVLMSKDKKYLILAELIDSTVDPAKEIMEKISLEDVPLRGNKNADITIVEYSDFQCPFCKRAHDMLPHVLNEYDGKVKLVYKQLPLSSIHPWAMSASKASLCVYDQGNDYFWKFHDTVFNKQKQINTGNQSEIFTEIAKDVGVDTEKLNRCMESPEITARINTEIEEAKLVGANSTPTFL